MSKVMLVLCALGILLLLVVGIANPNDPIMWLASTSFGFTILRAGMLIGLVALLVTHPPRNVYLRTGIGVFATCLATWVLASMYRGSIKFLDSMSMLEFSILAGLTVLEHVPAQVKGKVHKAAVKRIHRKPRLATA